MIIDAISQFVIFDEYPDKGHQFIYLLSRPISLKHLLYDPFLLIYTTSYIKRIIIKDLDDPMVEHCIVSLNNDGVVNFLKLSHPSEIKIKVKVLPTQSVTKNVMFLFEDKKILYTGHFTEYRSIQYNEYFIKCAKKRLNHLYIDNTLSQMNPFQYVNSIPKTCRAIRDLTDRFEDYKLHLLLDDVGYEDLLIALANIYPNQIHLDRFRSEIIPRNKLDIFSHSEDTSKIMVKNLMSHTKTPLDEIEKKFVKEKIITVKFTKEECLWLQMLNNYRNDVYRGLCLIQYTPHPSPIDLIDFIDSANAAEIHSIEHNQH